MVLLLSYSRGGKRRTGGRVPSRKRSGEVSFLNMVAFLMLGAWVLFSLSPGVASAKTIWCNPDNQSDEDGLTKNSGFKTLWRALAAMSSGDSVIISNGDWGKNTPGMSIDNNGHLPPSGVGYSGMSTIKAETDWKVRISYIKDLGIGRKYVRIQGIVVENEFNCLYRWEHSKIVRCGFLGKKEGGNTTAFSIVEGKNNLVEECIAWGGGRYKFLDLRGNHNIFRRCVARHDWYISHDWHGQESNFRGYGCHDSVWQNCISIDSNREEFLETRSKEDADFWIGDQTGAGGNIVDGCFVVKGMYQAYYLGGANMKTVKISNSVALGPSLEGLATLTGAVTYYAMQATINNSLFVNFNRGGQHFIFHKKATGSLRLTDSIAVNVGKMVGVTADYNCYFNTGSGNYGRHSINADPFLSGLIYPIRVESGSKLASAGSKGNVCGPTILKRIGISGACRDEQGWNVLTDHNLWPFPNEAEIIALMRKTVVGVSGFYGFCADGQTLTNYIWGYFGNTVPPFNVRATSGDGMVTLAWAPPADIALPTIVGFNVYNVTGGEKILMGGTVQGNKIYSKKITGLINGRSYDLVVTAIDKKKGESGYSYKARVIPARLAKRPDRKDAPVKAMQQESIKQSSEDGNKKRFTNKLGMEFVFIPPGSIEMGIQSDKRGKVNNAMPHQVTMTKGFYMQKTEVTQGQWKELMGKNPSFFEECGDDCPVEQVSWHEVQQAIKRLNRIEGTDKYRLPTEAEWEYACRAGTQTPFSFGKCLTTNQANYCGDHPYTGCKQGLYRQKPIPVNSFPPNAWGLIGMHGNIWEWCEDWLGEYRGDTVTDPLGSPTGSLRVIRGGGWNSYAKACRSGNRSGSDPAKYFANLGFRVVSER